MKRTLNLFSFSMVLALLVGLAGIHIPPAQAAPGETTLISLSNSASPMDANNSSYVSTISANGQFVAFQSYASSLVSSDTNGLSDIFVRDLQSGLTERVSIDSNGTQGNGASFQPAISADGRFVAFRSDAMNLVSNDTNGKSDIFVHDRQAHITERVSIGLNGTATNFESYEPAISGDGRFIAFVSFATNLVEGDTNTAFDIFVRDRQTGLTERVSIDSNGVQANSPSYQPAISADGRIVTFMSSASNLVAGDTNANWDIFVHDLETDLTERISVDSNGNQGASFSYAASISADGRFVAFVSAAMLVSGDTFGTQDIFVRDLQTGQTERIAFGPPGTGPAHDTYYTSISADGRYITFQSYAANLVSGDTNGKADIFVHDRQTDLT
jgi:Tol biopolymer transport system component